MSADEPRPCLYIGSTSHEVRSTEEGVTHFVRSLVRERTSTGGPLVVPGVPLGEVDDPHWVEAQLQLFDNISALRRVKPSTFGRSKNYKGVPAYRTRGDQQADVDEIDLRITERAQKGYPILRSTLEAHAIDPGSQRLQVGVNTIDLLVFALQKGAGKQLEPFLARTRKEAHEVWELTGGKVFYLIEMPSAIILANATRGKWEVRTWYAEALLRLVSVLPPGAGWGLHYCRGRLGGSAVGDHNRFLRTLGVHKRLYQPRYDVELNNTLLPYLEAHGYTPEAVQYPLALQGRAPSLASKDYNDYKYAYTPPGAKVYAGFVNPLLTFEQHAALLPVFDELFRQEVGLSATCGFGSDDLATMRYCIDMKNRLAYV